MRRFSPGTRERIDIAYPFTLPIRAATLADVPAIMSLERRAQTASHWPAEQYSKIFSGAEPQRLALIVEEESVVQGFLIARWAASEWEIENVVVADGVQRRGVASDLIVEVLNIARARGAAEIFLEVRDSNIAARRLYEKHGFKRNGQRKDYYHDPREDAILYRLQLS